MHMHIYITRTCTRTHVCVRVCMAVLNHLFQARHLAFTVVGLGLVIP